ncbi:MAG: NUDIX hydrolase [Eubacterium sp.]|nr:NUDIX hydrolase [Eubacterium sp.]
MNIFKVYESQADNVYSPITHCLAVVKVGDEYLLGWNKYRQEWEIFGGFREDGESIRECINRECEEELGLKDCEFSYLGIMSFKLAPGYFNPEWHHEFGALYGISLPVEAKKDIEAYRTDKEEVEKLAFYSEVKDKEPIALIDEYLLQSWCD